MYLFIHYIEQELSELREKVREMEEDKRFNLPSETSPLKEGLNLNATKRSVNIIYFIYAITDTKNLHIVHLHLHCFLIFRVFSS